MTLAYRYICFLICKFDELLTSNVACAVQPAVLVCETVAVPANIMLRLSIYIVRYIYSICKIPELWAPCAQLYSLAENPQPPPPPIPCIRAYLRGHYWSAKIDDSSLWPPGKYSERRWACTPPPPSPALANFSLMMVCKPAIGLCHTVYSVQVTVVFSRNFCIFFSEGHF